MKVLFFGWILSFCMTSCAQNNTKTKIMNTTTQEPITINNVTNKMWQEIPKYDIQPMYLLRINHKYCTYEVLVNDFPVYKNYSRGELATALKMNRAILKSGEQTVTIRMYPFGDILQKDFGDDRPYMSTLYGESGIQATVLKVDNWKNYPTIEDEYLIKAHETVGFENNKFPGEGLPYYEFSFTFTAKVPYEFEGWNNGVDLHKIDSTILRKKIWDYFKMYQRKYKEKKIDEIVNINYDNEVRTSSSEYDDKDQIRRIWTEYRKDVNISDKEFEPLKDYELAFYGGGKIVTFKHNSGLDIDPRLRGEPALYYLYENQSYAQFLGIYLYMPKNKYNGREEDLRLEMIK